jgi:hypothetical protein
LRPPYEDLSDGRQCCVERGDARRMSKQRNPGYDLPLQPGSQSDHSACSERTRYTVARLTPSVVAIVLADSPAACIRCARAAFAWSSALGRPIDWPRARRASRAAARRARPSSSSNAASPLRDPQPFRTPKSLDLLVIDLAVPAMGVMVSGPKTTTRKGRIRPVREVRHPQRRFVGLGQICENGQGLSSPRYA